MRSMFSGTVELMYRDKIRECPACTGILEFAGSVQSCPECKGTLVDKDVLESMVMAMTDDRAEGLRIETVERDVIRACPSCKEAMTSVLFHGATVECCPQHGFWFDQAELQEALRHAGENKPDEPTLSIWQTLSRVFHTPTMHDNDWERMLYNPDGHLHHGGWWPKV